jgi:hypothetical protein
MSMKISRTSPDPSASILFACVIVCVFGACGGPPGKAEIVLCPGSSVTVIGESGALTVRATSLTTRAYQVEDFDFAVDLIPRWQRWNGNLGLYRPAGGGDTHTVLEEGQQFFSNEDELYEWIEWAKRWGGELHYTADGLLMRWATRHRGPSETGPRRSLSVDVVQLMLRGKKPKALGGADDAPFTIRNPAQGGCTVGAAMHSRFVASGPATVGGRAYSGWALDVMKAHGIRAEDVENTIAHGRADRFEGRTTYTGAAEGDDWRKKFRVRVDGGGKVVLVFY